MLEEEMREIDECDMEEFDTLDSSEKTIVILGDRWRPQPANNTSKPSLCNTVYGNSVMSANLLEVSLVGVGTMLPFDRDAWSTVK